MAIIKCACCGKEFDKSTKRIRATEKAGSKHCCSRKCSSVLINEQNKTPPSTSNAEYTRKDKEKFPEKHQARYIVRQAIKSGKLTPLLECELCGSSSNIQGHHPDHSRPFLLLYLCPACHHRADMDSNKWEDLATDYIVCIKDMKK